MAYSPLTPGPASSIAKTPKPPGQQVADGVVRGTNGAMGVQGRGNPNPDTRPISHLRSPYGPDTRPISHPRPPSHGANLPMPAIAPAPARGTSAAMARAQTQDRAASGLAR